MVFGFHAERDPAGSGRCLISAPLSESAMAEVSSPVVPKLRKRQRTERLSWAGSAAGSMNRTASRMGRMGLVGKLIRLDFVGCKPAEDLDLEAAAEGDVGHLTPSSIAARANAPHSGSMALSFLIWILLRCPGEATCHAHAFRIADFSGNFPQRKSKNLAALAIRTQAADYEVIFPRQSKLSFWN